MKANSVWIINFIYLQKFQCWLRFQVHFQMLKTLPNLLQYHQWFAHHLGNLSKHPHQNYQNLHFLLNCWMSPTQVWFHHYMASINFLFTIPPVMQTNFILFSIFTTLPIPFILFIYIESILFYRLLLDHTLISIFYFQHLYLFSI